MSISTAAKVHLGSGLALALLLAVALAAWLGQRAFVAGNERVRHTDEIIDQMEGITSLVAEAESSRRGFMLTREARLLAHYETAIARLPPRLQDVRRLTADNPRQQQRLDELESLIDGKVAQLNASIALRRQGGDDAARQIAYTLAGVALTEAIRERCSFLVGEERTLLYQRAAHSAAVANIAEIFLILSGALGIVTVFLSGAAARHDLAARERAREELRELNSTLDHRVTERTAQLAAANHELDAFAYSVSHDLRAPVRGIDRFARIALEEHGPRLDAEGRRLLGIVSDEAQRMKRLIDDLLGFSRLCPHAMEVTEVDMNALVTEVFARLVEPGGERVPQLILHPLPAARGVQAMVRQVWTNLLANAVKFSRGQAAPCIEVGGVSTNGVNTYYVKDNGAGFDARYAHKLFGVFQRLHRSEEFEGTGVGLALVRRIVHRHGGKIWAEGKVNAGATFHFSLPQSGESS